jgi:transcriptional regulator with XRE-family HTH domain
MKTNGAAVRALRLAMGWRVCRFAEAARISPQYLSNIEAGRRQASPEVRVRIAAALGVPLSAIVSPVIEVTTLRDTAAA